MSDYVTNERRGAYRVQIFPALCDLMDFADSHAATGAHAHYNNVQLRRQLPDGRWTFGELESAATYKRALLTGWGDAVERIEKLQANLAANMAAPVDLRRRPTRSSQGDEYDIHSARAGRMGRAWTARTRQLTKSRAPLRIIVNATANADMTPDAFFWRGAAAIALAAPLTARGYKVAITALLGTRNTYACNKVSYLAAINVKGYGEKLDASRLAAVLCSSATLRYLGFRAMLNVAERGDLGFGYTMYGDSILAPALEANLFGHLPEERMVLPDLWSADKCAEWLKRVGAQFAA